ncbi:MAG: acyl-CoA dehydrogenase domain-containing protein, partial [Gammaproteobacteria bacterium]
KTGKVTALDLPGQIDQAEAGGILTAAEASRLREYDRKVMAIVDVDDFAPHELGRDSTPESHLATHPHLA